MKSYLIFIAWSPKEKKMYQPFDLLADDSIMKQSGLPLHIAPLSYFELRQFIGIEDSKGVKIFVGDIVELEYIRTKDKKKKLAVITFLPHKACWRATRGKDFIANVGNTDKYKVTVVGNIYENPELYNEIELESKRKQK